MDGQPGRRRNAVLTWQVMRARVATFWTGVDPVPLDLLERIRAEAACAAALRDELAPVGPPPQPTNRLLKNLITRQVWFRSQR